MRWGILICALIFIGAINLAVHAADPATKPSSPATKPSAIRLFTPYSKMTSLSDAEKVKIRDIHRKTLADKREIDTKEETAIMALLSDDQKKEYREIKEKESADRKMSEQDMGQ